VGVGRIDLENEHPLLNVLEEILGFGAEQLEHLRIGIGRDDIDRLLGEKLCGHPLFRTHTNFSGF
jgi:hypothetical protein